MSEDPLSQDILNTILARALDPARPPRPEDQPVFSIHRTIFPNSRLIVENPSSTATATVAVYNANSGRRLELGTVISTRDVGPFVIRLAHEEQEDAWNLIEALTPREGVVVLTYSSREIATRYVEEAAEIDLASDFDPASHFFGERRVAHHS